ncbi:hypothetical protein NC651_019267 [Populus alba x Populus x berolinensis]|nr:hypothetical protein NC651_019267 [Populus alba x Populus x berolinensis]
MDAALLGMHQGTFIYLVLQARIDMTAAACESAEKAAKIQDQETLLRAAVNVGDGRTYHPSFILHAWRPTCIWRPEADYISTSSALGRCAGCLMECIAFLILLNEQSQLHDLQGQAQQKFRPFCLVIRNSNMLLEIPNMSSTISSQLLVPLLQGGDCIVFILTQQKSNLYSTRVSNPGGVMPIQQQQLGSREAFGNMQPNAQNLQSSMAITDNGGEEEVAAYVRHEMMGSNKLGTETTASLRKPF